jgi:hypothetical protein
VFSPPTRAPADALPEAQVAARKARADFYQDLLEECKRMASSLHTASREKKQL